MRRRFDQLMDDEAMTTGSKIRLAIATAITLSIGVLVFVPLSPKETAKPTIENAESKIQNNPGANWNPGEDHPLVQPTDFYAQPESEMTLSNQPLPSYVKDQVNHESILVIRLLREGDLLADCWFTAVQDTVSNEQLHEARLIAKQYDAALRKLRRERAEILEHAGVSIKDPTEALKRNGVRFHQLFVEARAEFTRQLLTTEQKKLLREKFEYRRVARAKEQENRKPIEPARKVR
jgi:hypothetical protein